MGHMLPFYTSAHSNCLLPMCVLPSLLATHFRMHLKHPFLLEAFTDSLIQNKSPPEYSPIAHSTFFSEFIFLIEGNCSTIVLVSAIRQQVSAIGIVYISF